MNNKILTIIFTLLIPFGIANAETKRIGYILPLTGDAAVFGQEARRGIAIAQDKLKAQGQEVELFFQDEKCLPRDAVSGWRSLLNIKDITVIVGPSCSGSIVSVAPLASAQKRPLIALWDAGHEVAATGNHVFSIGFDSESEGRLVAKHLLNKNLKRIAVVWEGDKFAVQVKDTFVKTLEEGGGKVIGSGELLPSEQESRAVVSRLLANNPDAFFVSPAYSSAAIVKSIRTLGYRGPIFGQDTFGIPGVISAAPEVMEGAIFADVKIAETTPAVKSFKEEYIRRFSSEPSSLTFAAFGHDSLMLASQLPKVDQIKALKEIEWDAVLPRNSFKIGNMIRLEPSLFEVKGGKIVQYKETEQKGREG